MSTAALVLLAVAGIAFLLFLIIVLRIQAFISLLIASMVVAVIGGVPVGEVADTIREGMGGALGYIAIVVGVGAMFGEMLQISGGAEQIANTLLRRFGEERAPWALAITGLIVAIPVFLDVALILLIPLLYSVTRRTGRSLLFYGIPLLAGLGIGHAFIPPTPGPVAVAALLGADLGWVILFGLLIGTPAALITGLVFGRYIGRRIHVPVPENLAETPAPAVLTGERRLPSFGMVVTLIAIPLVLILLNTAGDVLLPEESRIGQWLVFIGHPFTALILSTLLAFWFLGKRMGFTADQIQQVASKSLEPVGLVILVTGAGGVFGRVLVATGIGQALADVMSASALPVLLLGFLIATVVRVSQGSATVAMITAAGLMAPILEPVNPSQPMLALVTMAIAAGATVVSHVNDSGFWLVGKLFGMTPQQTFRSWTVMETLLGLLALVFTFVASLFV